jgi:hypothetical protein
MSVSAREPERTELRNVDLQVISDSPLEPLVGAFGDSVDVLYVGEWGESYCARLELSGSGYQDEAGELIDRFVSLVEGLPEEPRGLWDSARTRKFDIGIQAAIESEMFQCSVAPATLEGVRRVQGMIVVTVYPPDTEPRSNIAVTWQPGRPHGQ